MSTALEAVLLRDRAIVVAALALITVIAWADLVWLANDMWMGGMDMTGFRMIPAGQGLMMPERAAWQPIEFGYVFAMWVVMMIGMMTPSAAPMILIYARVGRQAASAGQPFAATAWFAVGYLLSWTGFSLAATSAQWALQRTVLLTPMMESASNILGGIVLIAAGLYQWTAFKDACLSYCHAPLTFIMRHGGFRREAGGALMLGLRHGLYCIGCCWAIMMLLFVGGVMNLLWIAALAILVLLEKVLPFGRLVARLAGIAFVGGGAWLLLSCGLFEW
jgi:predicted metal-binding membrane protein